MFKKHAATSELAKEVLIVEKGICCCLKNISCENVNFAKLVVSGPNQHSRKLTKHQKSKKPQYQDENDTIISTFQLQFLDSYFDENKFNFKSKGLSLRNIRMTNKQKTRRKINGKTRTSPINKTKNIKTNPLICVLVIASARLIVLADISNRHLYNNINGFVSEMNLVTIPHFVVSRKNAEYLLLNNCLSYLCEFTSTYHKIIELESKSPETDSRERKWTCSYNEITHAEEVSVVTFKKGRTWINHNELKGYMTLSNAWMLPCCDV